VVVVDLPLAASLGYGRVVSQHMDDGSGRVVFESFAANLVGLSNKCVPYMEILREPRNEVITE
jgi:hypothetical protein